MLATATFRGESASGWQSVSFSSPVAISANTTYVASYFAPQGHYAYEQGFFNASLTTGPLTAPASGTTPNGVYFYGANGGFPADAFNATNYWVDPIFDTAPPGSTPQAITFEGLANKVYGDAAVTVAASGGGSGNPVTFTVTSPAGVCTSSGPNGSTITIVGVGTCTVQANQAGDATYAAAPPVSQSFTVAKAALTVTADAQSKVAGSANPALTATLSGFVNGQNLGSSGVSGAASCSTTATVASPAGSYPITCALGTLTAANYSFGPYVAGTLTVTGGVASQTITFAGLANKVYGVAPVTVAASGGGSGNPVTFTVTSPAGVCTSGGLNGSMITIVGVGTCTVQANQAGNASYTAAPPVSQSFTVTKAPLTVTADAKAKVYGSANPSLTSAISGFVNGQTLATSGVTGAPSCSTTAVTASAAGAYPITCVIGTLAAANYSFTFVAGTLTVTKAPLTVTGDAKSKISGNPNPALTATVSGFVLGQNLGSSGVSGAAACSTTATAASPAASYPITCAVGTLAAANYSFGPFVNGTLTVTVGLDNFFVSVSGSSTKTAGTSFSVTVRARTVTNTTLTGFLGTVHFASGDAQATLPADYTFVAGDSGLHTFTGVVLKTVGAQSITVTGSGKTGSVNLTITAVALDHFDVTAPASVTRNVNFSVTVTARDAFGNLTTSYSFTVHFTATGAGNVLPANNTLPGGSRTFTGVRLGTSGTQTITVSTTSGSLKTGASNVLVLP